MERALLLGIRSGVFLLLLMPLLVTSDTIFPYVVGKALYSRALIEAVFGLWLVLALISPSHRPPRSLLLKAYGVFLVVTLLAAFFGVSLQRSLWSDYRRMQGVVDLAHWFALVPVLVSAFRSLPDWRTLLNVNLAVSAVVALIGVAQQNDVGVPFLDFLEVKPRVDSTLGHPAWLGAYMLVNVLVGLGLLAFSTQRDRAPQATGRAARSRRRRMARTSLDSSLVWWRLFWLSAVVIDLWVLFQSGTRGAFTGLLAGLLVFALVYAVWGRLPSLRRLSFVVLGIVAAVVFFVVLARYVGPLDTVTSRNVTLERVANIGMDDPAIKGRVVSWGIGFDGFLARPVLGWGPESYTIVWGRFFESESGVLELLDQAHNKPLEELVTKGILGLLSYLLLWGIVFRALVIMVRAQDAREQLFTLFVGAALAAYFVQNLFLFDTATGSLQLALLLGFVVYQESKSESPETLRPASTPLSKMPRFMRPAVDSAHFSKYALALALILVSLSV